MPRTTCFTSCKGDVRPKLAVEMLEGRINHRQMTISELRLRYQGLEGFHLQGFWIEANDLHLRHIAEVDPSFLIDINLETALSNLSESVFWDRIFHNFTGCGIERANELRIEVRVPDVALRIKHLVVWRCVRPRQVVHRVDHLRRFAFRARQCL